MFTASTIFATSDGVLTKRYYQLLALAGDRGRVALNLMRSLKASFRAKRYRGRPAPGQPSYRTLAYDRKRWALEQLIAALETEGTLRYGWGIDSAQPVHRYVFYIDLASADMQVSFHAPERLAGPDYAGSWDGQHASEPRILQFCDAVMAGIEATQGVLL
mgnify:CR=1 FL=1